MRFDREQIQRMKDRLPLPQLMAMLGAGAHVHRSAWCPFHENTKDRAFSVHLGEQGWMWKCFSQCGYGDEIDFISLWERCSRAEALKRYSHHSGVSGAIYHAPVQASKSLFAATSNRDLKLPGDLHKGDRGELQTVATLREVSFDAVATMQQYDILRFGTVFRCPSWIVTDASGRIAEARRMDGRKFPAFKGGGERKVHTIGGSEKVPVGMVLPNKIHEYFTNILLLEGTGDLLAGYHFVLEEGQLGALWLPVAMPGSSMLISSNALPFFRDKRIRIIPHADEAGQRGAQKWAEQLGLIGCDVTGFNLARIRKPDGSTVKDLNDCTSDIHADDAAKLKHLLK